MKNRYSKKTATAPTCIDLFAGAGGLTLGFCQAGGIPVAAVDHDLDSTETYKKMFPMCKDVFCGNIQDWNPSNLDGIKIDIIIGGPPCQGFSLARGQRFVDDPRNSLYKEFVRSVNKFKPSWFVMENVQGITNIGEGIILRQIYEDFEAAGYVLDHKVINMAEFGVPQSRKRTVFVGNRLGKKFIWPVSTRQKNKQQTSLLPGFRSISEAIGDLPWPKGPFFAHRANSKMRGPRNRIADIEPAFTLRVRGDEFALCEKPATSAFIPDYVPDESDFYYQPAVGDYQKLMREDAPWWITDYKKPEEIAVKQKKLKGTRRLAVREQARLQSFPDWFEFSGRPYSKSKQIGNAVPPFFAKQLFAAILEQNKRQESPPLAFQQVETMSLATADQKD